MRDTLRTFDSRPLHLRRAARRHRLRLRSRGRDEIATDLDPLAPALWHADHFELVPRVEDPADVPALAELVEEYDVKLVVPLTDLDQLLLARSRGILEPALALVPEPEVCETMGDKYLAHAFFESHGIPSPRSRRPGDVPDDARYPLLVKVREGFGSRHIYRAHDRGELDFFLGYTTVASFVQECCRGEEFSVDLFCDLESRCLNAIPRTMIQSRAERRSGDRRGRGAHRRRCPSRRDGGDRRAGQRPVLPRARRPAPRHRRQPPLRRRLPAPTPSR